MYRRGQFGLMIIMVLIILVIVSIFVFIYLYGQNDAAKQNAAAALNKTYFNVTLASTASETVNYTLSNASGVILNGFLLSNIVEHYGVIENSTNITLAAYSLGYYYNSTSCNITMNDQLCKVSLKLKANDYVLNLTPYDVFINVSQGAIQAPILICFSFDDTMQNVVVNLPSASIPKGLLMNYDLCYSYAEDITGNVVIPINVHKNPYDLKIGTLGVLVRDSERSGYPNIGDVTASVQT